MASVCKATLSSAWYWLTLGSPAASTVTEQLVHLGPYIVQSAALKPKLVFPVKMLACNDLMLSLELLYLYVTVVLRVTVLCKETFHLL